MGILVIIKQMLVIGILVMTGYTLYKLKVIDEPASKKISTLVIDVCNPALAISCIIQNRQPVEHRQIIVAGCIGIIIYVILIGLGIILPYILRIPQGDRKVLSYDDSVYQHRFYWYTSCKGCITGRINDICNNI